MNILYLPIEFDKWFSAKKLSHSIGVGMMGGFTSDTNHITIPLMYHKDKWLKYVKQLVGSQKFDQVWLEVVHSIIPEDILEWLSTLAPIRVGFIIESLSMSPEEFNDNPVGTQRRIDNLNSKLSYLTHAVVCDRRDLKAFDIPTMFYSVTVPERLVKIPNSTNDPALFYGTSYGDRGEWIDILENKLIVNPPSPDDYSNLPALFEQLFAQEFEIFEYKKFFGYWYHIRQAIYSQWIEHLHSFKSCALVNLPHRTAVASGRVIESMASGKPVLSQLLKNEGDDLFEDGENIMYYNDPDSLIECINILQNDPDLRFKIAENARINILENYTTEVLIKRILEFTL